MSWISALVLLQDASFELTEFSQPPLKRRQDAAFVGQTGQTARRVWYGFFQLMKSCGGSEDQEQTRRSFAYERNSCCHMLVRLTSETHSAVRGRLTRM
eukprot:3674873-Rhodomonas_salina.2